MASHDKYETEQIGLWFTIEINQEEHVAFISMKALDEHFEAEQKCISPLTAYKRHRKCIHSVAKRKVIDGSTKQIVLRVSDFDSCA